MTSRERMITTLNHEKPDQVPIELDWRDEVWEAARKYLKMETDIEVAKFLGADTHRDVGLPKHWREFEKRVNGELSGPFGHIGRTILHDERTFENQWGVVQRVGSDGKYLEWVDGPFVKTDDLDSFDWPGDSVFVDDPSLAKKVETLKSEGYWVIGDSGVHPFKQAWHMRGFENFLCDYIANPEWVEAIYERILQYTLAACRRSAEAGVDMLDFWGDVAMQDNMMVPPDSWRRLDKPVWKRIIEETRKINPDIKFFFHSDGDTRPIIPDIIELGFDILNPIQPECVNPARIKAEYGEAITLDGGGSVQRTLPLGTRDDVRREVDFLMTTCAYNGGYIFRASNVVSFDCPVENIITFYEAARDWDLSKLTGPPETIPDEPPCMSVAVR